MSNIYFSASTKGFYLDDIHGDNIPDDAVKITAKRHDELMQAQAEGKSISADKGGHPVASDPPPPSAEEISAQLSRSAQEELDKSDVTVARCYEAGVPVPEQWRTYRSALRAIVKAPTSATELPTRPAYPAGT